MARAKVNFQVVDHGIIYLLYPITRRAKQWLKDNLPQDDMQYADASVVEYRNNRSVYTNPPEAPTPD